MNEWKHRAIRAELALHKLALKLSDETITCERRGRAPRCLANNAVDDAHDWSATN